MADRIIVIGIGNPGEEYEGTRHNVGFDVLRRVADEIEWTFQPRPGPVLAAEGKVEGRDVALVLPQSYVNRSGEAFASWLAGAPVDPARILVVLDDLALAPGVLRLRGRGSDGGHRGLGSLIRTLGTEELPRLRVGIGSVPAEAWREHVLSPFGPEERARVEPALRRAAVGVLGFLRGGAVESLQHEMNRASPPGRSRGTGAPVVAGKPAPGSSSAGRGRDRGESKVEQKLNKYEAMFLLNHAKVPPEGAESVQVVTDVLTKHGATIEHCEVWGERKLAYPIQHQRRGTYVLAHLEAPSAAIAHIQHDINISESILRWLPERQGAEFPPFRTSADWAEASGRRPRKDRPEGGRDERSGPAPQRGEVPARPATPEKGAEAPAAAPEAAAPTPPETPAAEAAPAAPAAPEAPAATEAPAAEAPAAEAAPSAPAPAAESGSDSGPAPEAGPESDKPEKSA